MSLADFLINAQILKVYPAAGSSSNLDFSFAALGAELATGNWTAGDGQWTNARNPVFTVPTDTNGHSATLAVAGLVSGERYLISLNPAFSITDNCSFVVGFDGGTISDPYTQPHNATSSKTLDVFWQCVVTATVDGSATLTITATKKLGGGTLTISPGLFSKYISKITENISTKTIADTQSSGWSLNYGMRGASYSTTPNLFFGDQHCLSVDMASGEGNISIGFSSLKENISGYHNIAIGYNSLLHNVAGGDNLGIGRSTLQNNRNGDNNVAVGAGAMWKNLTGFSNTAIGVGALQNNTTGAQNTVVGQGAMDQCTAGGGNTVVGYFAMQYLTTGNSNMAFGSRAALNLTTGSNNIAIGEASFGNATTQSNSVAIGAAALQAGGGGGCVAIGWNALVALTASNSWDNVAVGNRSANSLTSGYGNICVGRDSGNALGSSCNENVLVGPGANPPSGVSSKWVNIGDLYYGSRDTVKTALVSSAAPTSTTKNASAILQAESTTQGFLPPRMTTTQKSAISTPAEGLMVYDTTLHKLCVYTGSAWETITSA